MENRMGQVERIAVTEKTAAKMMDMSATKFRELVNFGAFPKPVSLGGGLKRWRVTDLKAIIDGTAAKNIEEFEL
jgi:predicted DNA-binding transcriptional regulator AlpA